ncbi:MAG: glutaredoxin family protein [Gallionella sp.]|nr:glutaredoxin family protein [Gallionella sp.]
MPSMIELYGTSCCHLCEQAQVILRDAGVVAKNIDIADDDNLLEKYGVRIPVLRRMDNGTELGWPFDAVAVMQFLA